MPSTPPPDRIRLTISVTPEVHASFQRLAAASSVSIGRSMGDWLGDTLEAVQFTAAKVEQARAAPRLALRELHGYAQGLVDHTTEIMERMRSGEVLVAQAGRSPAKLPEPRRTAPPPSNTGGKGQKTRAGKVGRGRS